MPLSGFLWGWDLPCFIVRLGRFLWREILTWDNEEVAALYRLAQKEVCVYYQEDTRFFI